MYPQNLPLQIIIKDVDRRGVLGLKNVIERKNNLILYLNELNTDSTKLCFPKGFILVF